MQRPSLRALLAAPVRPLSLDEQTLGSAEKRLLLGSPTLTLPTAAAYWPATPALPSRSPAAVPPAVQAARLMCANHGGLTSSQRTVLSLSAAASPSCKPKESHGTGDSETIQQTGWCGLVVMSFVYSRWYPNAHAPLCALAVLHGRCRPGSQRRSSKKSRKRCKYFELYEKRSVNVWIEWLFLNAITPKVFCYHLYTIFYFGSLNSSMHLHLLL